MRLIPHIKWRNLSIGMKLGLCFMIIVLIFIATTAYNYIQINNAKSYMVQLQDKSHKQRIAEQLKHLTLEISVLKNNLMVFHDPTTIERVQEIQRSIPPLVEDIAETAATREQRQWRNQLRVSSEEYIQFFEQAVTTLSDDSLSEEIRQETLLQLNRMSEIHKDYILNVVDQFSSVYNEEAESSQRQMLDTLNSTETAAFIMPSIGGGLAIVLSVFFIVQLRRPIKHLHTAVSAIADGDLRQKITTDSGDELGELSRYFNLMVDRMSQMLGKTQQIATLLKSHAESFHSFSHVTVEANGTIVNALKDIATGADEQASLTEESSTLALDMRNELHAIRTYAEEMHESGKEAQSRSEMGMTEVTTLQHTADQTEEILDKLDHSMELLTHQSDDIEQITQSIAEFSQQTNILAVNAAIVASHAGAEGKGFSVIADEVRELSVKSRQAAGHIDEIVSTLKQHMAEVRTNMYTVRGSMNLQKSHVSDTMQAFESIQQAMIGMTKQIAHIHQQITQTEGKQQAIVNTVQAVTAIAEQAAAGVQEINSNAEVQDQSIQQIADRAGEINDLSQQLFHEISRFKIDSTQYIKDEDTSTGVPTAMSRQKVSVAV